MGGVRSVKTKCSTDRAVFFFGLSERYMERCLGNRYENCSIFRMKKRDAYRQEVVSGWVGFLNGSPDDILRYESAKEQIYINHHLDEVKKTILQNTKR